MNARELRIAVRDLYATGASLDRVAEAYDLTIDDIRGMLGKDVMRDVDRLEGQTIAVERALGEKTELHQMFINARKWSPFAVAALEDLRVKADIEGVDLDDWMKSALARTLEKVIGGMKPDIAADRSGLGSGTLVNLLKKSKKMMTLFLEAQHVSDMRNLESLSAAVERGDGKLALDVMSRQTGDFAPPEKRVSVTGGHLKDAWKSLALEGEFTEVED